MDNSEKNVCIVGASGLLGSNVLKEALARGATKLHDDQINQMISEADFNNDNKISFEEFCKCINCGQNEYENNGQSFSTSNSFGDLQQFSPDKHKSFKDFEKIPYSPVR